MTNSLPPHERRNSRRLPMGSMARIYLDGSESIEAECVELSVGGMTLRANYVPGEAEELKVEVPTPYSGVERPPLVVRLAVKRCHCVGPGVYEIGGAIVEVIG